MVDHAVDGEPPSTSSPQEQQVPQQSGSLRWLRSFFRCIWRGFFRLIVGSRNVDVKKRLQDLSKEEMTVNTRLQKRSHSRKRFTRKIFYSAALFEVIAVVCAFVSAQAVDMPWKLRAVWISPVFLVIVCAVAVYWISDRCYKRMEKRDQQILERLRAERQTRVEELKRKNNFYETQQLIQKYDPDPTAKKAAAIYLSAMLGAESGLNLGLNPDSPAAVPSPTTSGVTPTSSGLRHRRPSRTVESPEQTDFMAALQAEMNEREADVDTVGVRGGGSAPGWFARLAGMVIGDDPTQCYALICFNCRRHNGLATKEDFPFVSYYCPHCHAWNSHVRQGEGEAPENAAEGGTPRGASVNHGNEAVPEGVVTAEAMVAAAAVAAAAVDTAGSQVSAQTAASTLTDTAGTTDTIGSTETTTITS